MKKKIFLTLVIMALLICTFVVSVSAVNATSENILGKYETDPGVDPITHRVTADVSFDLSEYFVRSANKNNVILGDTVAKSVLYDSVTNGYYVFESIYLTQDMTKFEYYVSDLNTAIAAYATANGVDTYPQFSMNNTWGNRGINEVVHYQMPEGPTTLASNHCLLKNNPLMKTIWVASTITSAGTHTFSYNRSLEYIYNFENVKLSDGFTFNNMFENSPRLKEVKLPNITATIGNLGQLWGIDADGVADTTVAASRTFRIYIPNDNYTLNSNFYQQSGNTGKFEFVFCGSDYEAFLAKNTVLADVTVVSSSEYTLGSFTNKYNFVCDYSYCDGYLNGVHTIDTEKSNECVVVCKDCLKTTINHVAEEFVVVEYLDYGSTGTKTIKCQNEGCTYNTTEEAPALFTCLGYSAPEFGAGGIAIGFTVNNEAIKEYTEATGKTLKYGVFAVSKNKLGNSDIFGEDGTVAEGVINAEIANYDFEAFELKIVGFTDEQKDTKLAMGAYVAVTEGETTEYSYMQSGTPEEGEKYCFVSYNDIVGVSSTDEEITSN